MSSDRTAIIARRCMSIGGFSLACCVLTLGLPMILVSTITVDTIRGRRWAFTRAVLFIEVFLVMEVLGVAIALLIWLLELPGLNRTRFETRNYRLQDWWGCTIGRAGIRLYDLRIEIEQDFDPENRPFVLFIRHTSFIDTFLPILLVSSVHGTRLRYVLKEELLMDPCLDIVGHRIPNVFIRRNARDATKEIEKIGGLAMGIGDGDGVLIYPEGTRFSTGKQARILAKAKEAGDEAYAFASQFSSVLPPRMGGAMALLEEAPHADAVFCAHVGLGPTASIRDLLSGDLVGTRVQVHFKRIASEEIPREDLVREAWFVEQWVKVDRRVTEWNNQTKQDDL